MLTDTIERKARKARKDRFFSAVLAVLAFPLITAASPAPHVRPESAETQALVRDAARRSPLVRALIDRLDQSDVVAYIRFARFTDPLLEGRVGWLSQAGGRRYVVIELSGGRLWPVQIATLAHELQHAVEIAGAPAIVDTRTLADHYGRIGMRTSHTQGLETFETRAAIAMGAQARREIMTGTVRTTEEE